MPTSTCVREVLFSEFSVLDFESSLKDLFCFFTSDCDMNCDFLVSLDAKASDGESGSGGDWLLSAEILKHFGGCM